MFGSKPEVDQGSLYKTRLDAFNIMFLAANKYLPKLSKVMFMKEICLEACLLFGIVIPFPSASG